MRQTKITPGSNKLWEGSRMMLPEHVRAINEWRDQQKKKQRPIFDEQVSEELNYRIQLALVSKSQVTITVFGEYEDTRITGVVQEIDQLHGWIKLDLGGSVIQMKLVDVLDIRFLKSL